MKIVSIGGGPAGLFFSILMKKMVPDAQITVHERNRPDDTFGWGVVFSDETLDNIHEADPESLDEIARSFIHWTDIETYYRGSCVTSTGHGFSGLSRKRLLNILQDRCESLGVELLFESDVADLDAVSDGADLVLAVDGVNSFIRDRHADVFKPTLDWRRCRFSWLGTTKPLDAFTFVFAEGEHGLFQAHAYPFEDGLSTWIVETREECWRAAGLDQTTEEETARYCTDLFAPWLDGHLLLNNRSLWRSFPTVRCERWYHDNIVLMGDAAHTAHYSIGSGTKLAMEDAIALRDAFVEHAGRPTEQILAAYQDARHVDVLKTQKAAQTSLEWFENSARYLRQDPHRFQFNLMTRSKKITYDNLQLRDPALVETVTERFRVEEDAPKDSDGNASPPMFAPYRLRGMTLANRIVVSPMCQYSATDGTVDDWHLVHLGSRAMGGASLVITEMTNVSADGRITPGCAGIYSDEHVAAWRRITDFVHASTPAKIGLQIAHAGRKGSCAHPWEGRDVPLTEGGWSTIGPSPVPFEDDWPTPREMDRADMERVRDEFVRATERALEAGFDLLEVHMAHGYLLSSFISPASNRRDDEYGGPLVNRMRWPLEVFDGVRAAWPEDRPISVRISATDWVPKDADGLTGDDAVAVARLLQEHGCDLVDVSSGGNTPESEPIYGRMYQVPFAERIKYEVGVPVMAVGAILGADHANTVLAAGRADLVCMARPHLRDPYLTQRAASELDYPDQWWPGPYLAGRPARPTS
ncbi:MAG: oxidoreductase [Planctomycetes bacterium]|nr:oxidoreductase [Planctomycetota bacterium]